MARSGRFELPTPRFVVWCSIQLSYERMAKVFAPRLHCGKDADHINIRYALQAPNYARVQIDMFIDPLYTHRITSWK